MRAGFTQEQLAFRMTQLGEPTSRRQIGQWESGKQMPGAGKFLIVLRATALPAGTRKTQAERDIEEVEAQLWAILDRLRDVQPRRRQDD
jgi:transcriptional regulator with XRE-family HTH domain